MRTQTRRLFFYFGHSLGLSFLRRQSILRKAAFSPFSPLLFCGETALFWINKNGRAACSFSGKMFLLNLSFSAAVYIGPLVNEGEIADRIAAFPCKARGNQEIGLCTAEFLHDAFCLWRRLFFSCFILRQKQKERTPGGALLRPVTPFYARFVSAFSKSCETAARR